MAARPTTTTGRSTAICCSGTTSWAARLRSPPWASASTKSRWRALDHQLTVSGCDDRRELPFHKMLLAGELPLTMGGGIGQSRLCMLMIGTAHIGEVQVSLWDDDTLKTCADAGILLL